MKKALSLVSISILLSACANQNIQPAEHWTTLTKQQINLGTVPDNLAQVVIIRQKNSLSGPAANVFLQDNYITSLIPGSYQVINVCPEKQTFTTQFTSINGRKEEKTQQSFEFKAGQTAFLTMVQEGRRIHLKPLQANLICPVLDHLKRQSYSIVRGQQDKNCGAKILKPISVKKNNTSFVSRNFERLPEIDIYFGE